LHTQRRRREHFWPRNQIRRLEVLREHICHAEHAAAAGLNLGLFFLSFFLLLDLV
jgi:hypothetical protein